MRVHRLEYRVLPALGFVAVLACAAAGAAFESPGADSSGFGPPPAHGPGDPGRKMPVIADSHVTPHMADDYRYIKASSISRELLANFVGDINRHVPPVDFAAHLGDVTEHGIAGEFAEARVILDSLRCPLYPVVGNHDNFQSDAKQAWMDCFGLDSTHYAFDYYGMHFIVIDCTLQPYVPPRVHCHAVERAWVQQDLAANADKPAIILSHYNMWERGWCATFDTTCHYQEYEGMAFLREILEEAGNVVAVINGHVHANRVEVHNGIYYIDINATLVGRPSIRYFYVYPDRIEVDYEYISDDGLFGHVQGLCPSCMYCFDPYAVCDFIDGEEGDKRFTIPYGAQAAGVECGVPRAFDLDIVRDGAGRLLARIAGGREGIVALAVYDVRGRRIEASKVYKDEGAVVIDLGRELPGLADISGGVYFVSATIGGTTRTSKLPLVK